MTIIHALELWALAAIVLGLLLAYGLGWVDGK